MSASKRHRHGKMEKVGLAALKDQLLKSGAQLDNEPFETHAGERKLSEVLLELIEPYKKHAKTEQDFETLITFAMVAWNASVLGVEKGSSFVNDFFQSTEQVVGSYNNQEVKKLVLSLITEKERLYPNDKRFITKKLIQHDHKGNLNLSVAFVDTVG